MSASATPCLGAERLVRTTNIVPHKLRPEHLEVGRPFQAPFGPGGDRLRPWGAHRHRTRRPPFCQRRGPTSGSPAGAPEPLKVSADTQRSTSPRTAIPLPGGTRASRSPPSPVRIRTGSHDRRHRNTTGYHLGVDPAIAWATLGVVIAILGVVIVGFVGVVTISRVDTNAIRSEMGQVRNELGGRIDKLDTKVDHLTERVEEHLRTHAGT